MLIMALIETGAIFLCMGKYSNRCRVLVSAIVDAMNIHAQITHYPQLLEQSLLRKIMFKSMFMGGDYLLERNNLLPFNKIWRYSANSLRLTDQE